MTKSKTPHNLLSCPLCKEQTDNVATTQGTVLEFNCRICGKVVVHEAFDPDKYNQVLHLLSGWTRERTENSSPPITIIPEDIDPVTEGLSVPAITSLPCIPKSIDEKLVNF